ncbi:MAG: hypothetical protein RR207_04215 [Clostridia bacterium]
MKKEYSPEIWDSLRVLYYEGLTYCFVNVANPSSARAVKCLTDSAKFFYPDSFFALGEIYRLGFDCAKNIPIAKDWYEKGKESGSAKCAYALAKDSDDNQIYAENFQELFSQAHDRDEISQYIISQYFKFGLGDTEKNLNAYFYWLTESALDGYTVACYELANCYKDGFCVDANEIIANEWYAKCSQPQIPVRQELLSIVEQFNQQSTSAKNIIEQAQEDLQKETENAEGQNEEIKLQVKEEIKPEIEKIEQQPQLKVEETKPEIEKVEELKPEIKPEIEKVEEIKQETKPEVEELEQKPQLKVEEIKQEAKPEIEELEQKPQLKVEEIKQEVNLQEIVKPIVVAEQDDAGDIASSDLLSYNELKKLALGGSGEAMFKLGLFYEKRRNTPQNLTRGVYWYQKAVECGNAMAQNNLGIYYQKGIGVEKNEEKAVELYCLSCQQDYAPALYNYANCYMNHIGVKRSYVEAARLLERSATLGYAPAMCQIGLLYQTGRGVSLDYEKAFYWYGKASQQGIKEIDEELAFCKRKLEQIEKDKLDQIERFGIPKKD